MNNKNNSEVSSVLKALLEGGRLNRKDFNNSSLHSRISAIQNKKYTPVESIRTHDGTCDYFMLDEEIKRFFIPELREQQRQEMKDYVLMRRHQRAMRRLEQANTFTQIGKVQTCQKIVGLGESAPELTGGSLHE